MSWQSMIQVIKALPRVPPSVPSSRIILSDGLDHAVLTKMSWPLIFGSLHEIEVRIRGTCPTCASPAVHVLMLVDIESNATPEQGQY